ncbi:MetQ/NlpA family ABC transporter substrate-binding protein [Thermoflavimicrobium dichotomicum]|uniref:Lipoprotein n=1 Tax=Thermoflavimicrobium dichotomicum TaxID=46223 RepID=A0A1I3JYH7_9BACL|nr:MetQ/NlpA family ABC transporter substrate-binding protein [Thermoflavimicrobium dichotomicum]SFI65327.1 D-methionine transport system substrate-binding protein [Thermoflavimicrobium dichotomicum]
MKKCWAILAALLVGVVATACGGAGTTSGDKGTKKVTVAASQVPHAEILEHVKPQLKKEGIDLEVKVFQDYVLPNKVVEEGKMDANFFQHVPFMETTNKESNYHIVKVTGVHIEPMAAYSKKIKNVKDLKDGATIALPNDTSNLTRSLLLLENQKLIQLDNREGNKTERNIKSNPKKLKFKLVEPALLPRVLDQVDLAIINTNYAIQAKLNPLKDNLFIEDKNSPYVNILATKKGKEKDEAIQKLAKVLNSPETKKFIEDKYKGAVVPAF